MYKCAEDEDTINEVLNGATVDKLFSHSRAGFLDRDLLCIDTFHHLPRGQSDID